uniref:Uncharacterized protein n=1 Tax=Terrapene triunguis TaxID=2587831 RepID=A0A674K0V3_9SAUR
MPLACGNNAMGTVAVVIDNGSCFTRAGFAGEDKPKSVLKTTSMPLTSPLRLSLSECILVHCLRNTTLLLDFLSFYFWGCRYTNWNQSN